MAVAKILALVPLVVKALLAILRRLDPKTIDMVKRKKAVDWAEKYIFMNEKIEDLRKVKPWGDSQERTLEKYQRKLAYFRKWFFENN